MILRNATRSLRTGVNGHDFRKRFASIITRDDDAAYGIDGRSLSVSVSVCVALRVRLVDAHTMRRSTYTLRVVESNACVCERERKQRCGHDKERERERERETYIRCHLTGDGLISCVRACMELELLSCARYENM